MKDLSKNTRLELQELAKCKKMTESKIVELAVHEYYKNYKKNGEPDKPEDNVSGDDSGDGNTGLEKTLDLKAVEPIITTDKQLSQPNQTPNKNLQPKKPVYASTRQGVSAPKADDDKQSEAEYQ